MVLFLNNYCKAKLRSESWVTLLFHSFFFNHGFKITGVLKSAFGVTNLEIIIIFCSIQDYVTYKMNE